MSIEKKPTWKEVEIPESPALSGDIEADVAVIGGGMTGMVTAYLLGKSGKKKVVVIEKKKVGSGATEYTTAFITQIIDTDISDLKEMYGSAKTKKILESHGKAMDLIEEIAETHDIDCEFMRCSDFSYANDEEEKERLLEEEKEAQDMPVDVTFHDDDALGFKNVGYLEIKNQGKFHPYKYLAALVSIVKGMGVEIYQESEVKEIKGKGPYTLVIDGGTVTAKHVVAATYGPIGKKLFFKKAFYDSYVFEMEIAAGKIPEGIYEDSMDPYHYFRVDRKGDTDRVILGGEDHRSDIRVDNSKNYQALLDYAGEIFAGIPHKAVRKWEGPIIESVDGLAYIGPHRDKNIFYATAFSGNGMTYSHIAARIISDKILGKKNEDASLYDAERKPALKHLIKKGRDYGAEFVHGAVKNTLKYRKKDI